MPRDGTTEHHVERELRTAVLTLLLPVFFVLIGLSTRIDLLDSAYLWGVTAVVTLTAVGAKWGGSMLAARPTGEPWRDAAVIGVVLNIGGLTELVILSVGLELGVIDSTVFTVMVLMALVTTLTAAPLLRVVAPRRLRPVNQRVEEAPADEAVGARPRAVSGGSRRRRPG